MAEDELTLAEMQDRVRERAAAYLTIHSETESPAALAEALALEPDDQWAKGESRGRLAKLAPSNAVTFNSGLTEDQSSTDHVSALVERLRPHSEEIRALISREGTWAVTRIVEHAGFATEWFANIEAYVRPDDLRTLAELGAALAFDAYVYTDDD